MSRYTDVTSWHRAAGVPVADHLTPLSPDRLALRLALLEEEYTELVDALKAGDVAGAAKESADLVTVALGTDAEQGIDSDMVWAAVHASNMAKLGPNGAVARRADGKILKPEGWQPPDIAAVLAGTAAQPGIRPVTYWEGWCTGDGSGEHQFEFGDMTAYLQREGVASDLDDMGAVVLPDGRVYCVDHIPADVCPDSADNQHEWDDDPDPDEASCIHCGIYRAVVAVRCDPAGGDRVSDDIAYRSTDPTVLDAWEQIDRDYKAWADRVQEWLTSLGMHGRSVRLFTNPFTGTRAVAGIDCDTVPAGWRAHRDGYIVPDKRTATGRADYDRMQALSSPPVRQLLQDATGMPTAWLTADMRQVQAGIKRYGDRLYALMSAAPEPEPPAERWERIPLSVYYAAVEAAAERAGAPC